jgi:uncharacterized protein (DUF58 family)
VTAAAAEPPPRPRVKAASRLLPVLWWAMLAIQLAFPYRGWIIMLVGLGGAWLLARLWAHSLADGLSLERETRFHWSQVGDQMLERLTLVNRSPFPAAWVELIDRSSVPMARRSRAFAIGRNTSLRWHERIVCRQRGKFVLGPTTLRTGDPFGLFDVEINLTETASLLVLPPVIAWTSLPVLSRGRDEEGRATRSQVESGVAAAQVRPYQPGDSLRRIHWPSTAKHGELHIRQFDRATRGDWMIVLDMTPGHHSGTGTESTIEACVILAASVADYGLSEGRSVGLVSLGPEGLVWSAPRQGASHRWDILASLADVQLGETDLADLIRLASRRLGAETSLMAVTPCTDMAQFEPLLAEEGRRRPARAGVVLLEPGTASRGETAQVAERLRQRGLLTWVIRQTALGEALSPRLPAVVQPDSGPGWQKLS